MGGKGEMTNREGGSGWGNTMRVRGSGRRLWEHGQEDHQRK